MCDQCGYAASRRYHLTIHVNAVHKRRKDYKCELCNLSVAHLESLKQHMRKVHIQDRRFACGQCDRVFGTKATLKQHIEYVHSECKLFCEMCGRDRLFVSEEQLETHLRNYHNVIAKIVPKNKR